jgi:rhamnosyltransferase
MEKNSCSMAQKMVQCSEKDCFMSIGVAFITYNAKHHLPNCLPPILNSGLKPRVLVLNASSHDGTVELAKKMGVETLTIPRFKYNHGLTREQARRHLGTDIVVMMTPDAYAVDENMLEKLVDPLRKGSASIAYARQIPHDGAGFFESFSRRFNYPEASELRRLDDLHRLGVYTFFCSNSCAAYLNSALDQIGGFTSTLFGEDTIAAAKLLRMGHAIAYAAEAVVKHSHDYTLLQEFKRSFDIGLYRKEISDLFEGAGTDSARGRAFAKSMLKRLLKENPLLIPYGCLHLASKWTGYQLGKASTKKPAGFKKLFSSQNFYWFSEEGIKASQHKK